MVKLNRSIVLVGLMGAGKTSVGRKLSTLLGVQFCDSDDEVEAAANMKIPEIFKSFGQDEFRRLERAVIARLLMSEPLVLSTGGGAFIQHDVRNEIAKDSVSVWLSADPEVLWGRVADKPGRPLLDAPNPYETLVELAKKRDPVYQQADVTVRSDRNDTLEDVAKSIIRALVARDDTETAPRVFDRSMQP